MHLDGIAYKLALRRLTDSFDSARDTVAYEQNIVTHAANIIQTLPAESVVLPIPMSVAEKWPHVSKWLHKVRGIPVKLVTLLYERGLVYADARSNVVFIRTGGGAFVRGTGKPPFKRTYGGADCGAFEIPGNASSGIYLVEGPIDAIAIKAMHSDALAIATGGNLLSVSRIIDILQKRQLIDDPIFIAFDNDERGESLSLETSKVIESIRYAPPKGFKDWADAIKKNPGLIAAKWVDT